MNKYLEGDSESENDDNEIDIHEVVRTGTLAEVKEAIMRDRPHYIAKKDEVRMFYFYVLLSYELIIVPYILYVAWQDCIALCRRIE